MARPAINCFLYLRDKDDLNRLQPSAMGNEIPTIFQSRLLVPFLDIQMLGWQQFTGVLAADVLNVTLLENYLLPVRATG
jgi:hypothetical protein